MKLKVFALTLVLLLSLFVPVTASAAGSAPFTLAAPTNLTAELKYDTNGVPYFELKLNTPPSVTAVNEKILNGEYDGMFFEEICIQFDYKYGNFDWNEGDSFNWNTSVYLTEFLEDGSFDYTPWGEYDASDNLTIEAGTYQFRAYYYTNWGYEGDWIDKTVVSPNTNIVTVGNNAYSGASSWAKAELDKAAGYGFITDRIKGNMSGNLTREEFAEVAVRMYEYYTGKKATYTDMSAFTDTQNPEVFKAYTLDIVGGIGNNKFNPNGILTRDQLATMLFRLVRAIAPKTDFSITGAPSFADEKDIPGWAFTEVKFMSLKGFVGGTGANRYEPQLKSTREQAVAVAVRVYEHYAGISG